MGGPGSDCTVTVQLIVHGSVSPHRTVHGIVSPRRIVHGMLVHTGLCTDGYSKEPRREAAHPAEGREGAQLIERRTGAV